MIRKLMCVLILFSAQHISTNELLIKNLLLAGSIAWATKPKLFPLTPEITTADPAYRLFLRPIGGALMTWASIHTGLDLMLASRKGIHTCIATLGAFWLTGEMLGASAADILATLKKRAQNSANNKLSCDHCACKTSEAKLLKQDAQ